MRLLFAMPLIAALSLTACNKAGSGAEGGGGAADGAAGTSSSLPDKAAAAIGAMHFEPGLYQATVDIKAFDMPGMPAGALASVKSGMAGKPVTYCLSAEDAAKGMEAMKQHMAKGQCQFEKFDVSNGTIDTSMTCQMGPQTMHTVGHGTFTDTGTVVASTADMTGAGGKKIHIEQVTTTKRIGDCTK
ncbi:MAG: DUF3617 domain-containing protein [Novosphingobium sp.]